MNAHSEQKKHWKKKRNVRVPCRAGSWREAPAAAVTARFPGVEARPPGMSGSSMCVVMNDVPENCCSVREAMEMVHKLGQGEVDRADKTFWVQAFDR